MRGQSQTDTTWSYASAIDCATSSTRYSPPTHQRVRHQERSRRPPGRAEGADPWEDVETYLADLVQPDTGLVSLATPVNVAADVDRARAAVEAQHQQAIVRLTAEVQHWRDAAAEVGATDGHGVVLTVQRLTQERDEAISQATADREWRIADNDANKFLKAERDALARQLAGLRERVHFWRREYGVFGHLSGQSLQEMDARAAFPEGGQAPASPENQP